MCDSCGNHDHEEKKDGGCGHGDGCTCGEKKEESSEE